MPGTTSSREVQVPDPIPSARVVRRVLAWLVVLVPATWGVVQVAQKAAALFR
jgi:hypothetical protein